MNHIPITQTFKSEKSIGTAGNDLKWSKMAKFGCKEL